MAQDIIDCRKFPGNCLTTAHDMLSAAPDPVDNNVDRASSGPDGAATLRAVKQEAQELRVSRWMGSVWLLTECLRYRNV